MQDPIPGGKSFFFRANGLPIPVRGSNWIPSDAFEDRVTRENTEKFFIAMRDSNQNMIRNWGGAFNNYCY